MLGLAGLRLLWRAPLKNQAEIVHPPLLAAVGGGAGIGFLSGLTGTGGGIFLSPLLLFKGWAEPRKASGIASVFILFNSMAGLAGNLASVGRLPAQLPFFMIAVVMGALGGTALGTTILPTQRLLHALGAVLIIACAKLVLT